MKTRIRYEVGPYLLIGVDSSMALIDEENTSSGVVASLTEALDLCPSALVNSLDMLTRSQEPSSFAAVIALNDSLMRVVVSGSMSALVEFASGTLKLEPFGGAVLSLVLPACDVLYLQPNSFESLVVGGDDLADTTTRATRCALELKERTHLAVPAALTKPKSNIAITPPSGTDPMSTVGVAEGTKVHIDPPVVQQVQETNAENDPSEIQADPIPITRNDTPGQSDSSQRWTSSEHVAASNAKSSLVRPSDSANPLPPPPPRPSKAEADLLPAHKAVQAQQAPVSALTPPPSPPVSVPVTPLAQPPKSQRQAILITDDGISHAITQDTIIGREPETHPSVQDGSALAWRLPDPSLELSRSHLGVYLKNSIVTVRDLGSSNGSILLRAGQDCAIPIYSSAETLIQTGDRILLGKRTIELHM